MGIRNESFMKMAAVGTWMGDFVTAWMVRLFTVVIYSHAEEWGKYLKEFRLTLLFILFRKVTISSRH